MNIRIYTLEDDTFNCIKDFSSEELSLILFKLDELEGSTFNTNHSIQISYDENGKIIKK